MRTEDFITLFMSILSRPKQPNPMIRQQALAGLEDAANVLRRFGYSL